MEIEVTFWKLPRRELRSALIPRLDGSIAAEFSSISSVPGVGLTLRGSREGRGWRLDGELFEIMLPTAFSEAEVAALSSPAF